MYDLISIRTLLALLIACPMAVSASSLSHDEREHEVSCRKASCTMSKADDRDADYVFGTSRHEHKSKKRPDRGWDKHAHRGMDKEYGPSLIPPRGRPDLIHTGSGKDIVPAVPAANPIVPAPTAVPVPAALWLLLSGAAALGLGAWRRGRL